MAILCEGVSSWCHAVLAILQKTCSGVGSSVCVSVCVWETERDKDLCLFLHLLKELWDCDLIGVSWTGTSGLDGGSMTGVCSCDNRGGEMWNTSILNDKRHRGEIIPIREYSKKRAKWWRTSVEADNQSVMLIEPDGQIPLLADSLAPPLSPVLLAPLSLLISCLKNIRVINLIILQPRWTHHLPRAPLALSLLV